MEADSARPLDLLLGHRGWVLALARSLLADPEAAEDVAQETWLAALRRPPEPDRPPRPWLARVVRNLAFERLRSDAARAGRERDAARGGGAGDGPELPATDELLARLETQRVLAELLESLDEPYRTALLLRHVEGLSSAEIARRQGVPSATVRSRVQRGLELLRARLDARYGSRRAWGLALGGLLGRIPVPPPAGSPPASAEPLATPVAAPAAGVELGAGAGSGAAALSGVLVMSLVWKLAAAAALVVTGVLFATRLGSSPAPAGAPGGVAAAPAAPAAVVAAVPVQPGRPALTSGSGEPTRSAAAAPAAPIAAVGQAAGEPEAASGRVEGRVVDELGRPLSGASVRGLDEDRDLRLTTRGDGSFDFERRMGERDRLMVTLVVSYPGRATHFGGAELRRDDTSHLGNLVLPPGAWVEGRVLAPRGRPAAGAQVLVTGPDLPWSPMAARASGPDVEGPVPEALCGADGRFRVEGLPAGSARVWAVAEGMRWTHGEPLELEAGSGVGNVELTLEARADADRIAGRVLDPAGRGVATQVQYSFQVPSMGMSSAIESDEQGRFELWLQARAPHDLRARSTDERWADAVARAVEPGSVELVLQLRESELLPVRVTGPAGPVEEYSLTVIEAGSSEQLSAEAGTSHPGGRSEVRVPAVPFQVRAAASGHTLGLSRELDPEALPASLELQLEAAPVVMGRVVDERGEPVSGAQVELRQVHADDLQAFSNGFRVLYWSAHESDRSDGEGRFALTLREPGRYVAVASKAGRPEAVSEVLDLGPQGARGLELAWVPGGAIEGRVLADPGVDPSGTVVVVNRGDGRARSRRAGPDGSFRFDGLGVGPWQVLAADAEIDPQQSTSTIGRGGGPIPMEWHCRVESGSTTWHDLDVRSDQACRLRGSLALDGRPAERAWVVRLEHGQVRDEAFELPSTTLDREGRFELQVAAPGDYRLLLIRTEDQRVTRIIHDLHLEPGDSAWELALETAALEIDNAPVDADSERALRFVWNDAERGVLWETFAEGDPTGRLELSRVPAGRGLLQTFAAPDEHGWRGFDDRLTVELEPGQREQVVLP